MSDTYGLTSATPLARYDRDSQSWRTCEDTCLWDLPMSLETLPAWGMTRDGELFELPTPERLTVALEYSSLPTPTAQAAKHGPTADTTANGFGYNLWDLPHLLPTPLSRDHKDQALLPYHRDGELQTDSLPRAVGTLLPTPQHSDWKGPNFSKSGSQSANSLFTIAVTALLPTPAVNDMGRGKTIEWWDEWAPRQKSADGRPAPHGKSLAIEAMKLARDGESTTQQSDAGKP